MTADRRRSSGRIIWEISVDSMIPRAHQHAAGARSTPQKESAGGVTDPATLAKIAALAHIHDKQRGDHHPWACPVDRLVHTLWAVFWITLGWLFLPGINVFLFILSLVLMTPAMINTRR
jgi:hypothetical protein